MHAVQPVLQPLRLTQHSVGGSGSIARLVFLLPFTWPDSDGLQAKVEPSSGGVFRVLVTTDMFENIEHTLKFRDSEFRTLLVPRTFEVPGRGSLGTFSYTKGPELVGRLFSLSNRTQTAGGSPSYRINRST